MYTRPVWVPRLLRSTPRPLPQATPRGATQVGATLYGGCRANRAPGHRDEGGGRGSTGAGDLRRPRPPMGAVCWAITKAPLAGMYQKGGWGIRLFKSWTLVRLRGSGG